MSNKVTSNLSENSPIKEFYADKSVFITGGTGFLGLVFVEKLLYSCSDIKNIYLFIRTKEGKTGHERIDDLIKSPVFRRIKEEKPEVLNKIIPIVGDFSQPHLGISEEDRACLLKEVSMVFHAAADVNFDPPIREAIATNTRFTQTLLYFCRNMKQLQALIYISTAYSNSNRSVIDEQVYPTSCSLQSVYYTLENTPGDTWVKNLLENRPNIYTYTKALSEELLVNEKGDIPVAIVRPSVILSAIKEPLKGWIDGWNGPNGVIAGIGKGVLRSWYGQPDSVGDVIPVDTVANLMVAVAWDTHARNSTGDKDVKVFNCGSGLQNPVTLKTYLMTSLKYTQEKLFNGVILYPSVIFTNSPLLYWLYFIFLQLIPAAIIDAFTWLGGGKPKMVKIQRKFIKLKKIFEYFLWNQFVFVDSNVKKLYDSLNSEDRQTFDFNIKKLNWDEYIKNYVFGLREYLLKNK